MTNCSVVCPGVPLSSMFSDYSCAVEVEGTILSTFPLLSIAQVETESFLCVQSIVPCSFFYEICFLILSTNVQGNTAVNYTDIFKIQEIFFKKLIEYAHDVKDFFYVGRILDQGWL